MFPACFFFLPGLQTCANMQKTDITESVLYLLWILYELGMKFYWSFGYNLFLQHNLLYSELDVFCFPPEWLEGRDITKILMPLNMGGLDDRSYCTMSQRLCEAVTDISRVPSKGAYFSVIEIWISKGVSRSWQGDVSISGGMVSQSETRWVSASPFWSGATLRTRYYDCIYQWMSTLGNHRDAFS